MASISGLLDTNATPWLGFRYAIVPLNVDLHPEMVLARVAEIQFPNASVEQTIIPTLSTRETKIPSRIVFGDLVLRGAVFTDTQPLWNQIKKQIDMLEGKTPYVETPIDFLITTFEHGSFIKSVPLANWIIRGAQAKSYAPAPANANSDALPLQELTLSVDSISLQ